MRCAVVTLFMLRYNWEGRVVVIPCFEVLQFDMMAKFRITSDGNLVNSDEISLKIWWNSGRACKKTGNPQQKNN